MNDAEVKVVEDTAKSQGIKSLKFSSRRNENVLLHDGDLLTGVSNEEDEDHDSKSNKLIDENGLLVKRSGARTNSMQSDNVLKNDDEGVTDDDEITNL